MDKPTNNTLSKQSTNKASKHAKNKLSKFLVATNSPRNSSQGNWPTEPRHMQSVSEFDPMSLDRPVLKTESLAKQVEEKQKKEWDSRTKIPKKKVVTTTIYLGETLKEASNYDEHQCELSARHVKCEDQTDEIK